MIFLRNASNVFHNKKLKSMGIYYNGTKFDLEADSHNSLYHILDFLDNKNLLVKRNIEPKSNILLSSVCVIV